VRLKGGREMIKVTCLDDSKLLVNAEKIQSLKEAPDTVITFTNKASMMVKPRLSDFLLDLHQSLAHQGLAKSLDISIGMSALFANLAASRS